MEQKQCVYFKFSANSEGAERMNKLLSDIKYCEEKAESLAASMNVLAYYPDCTAEFGGISLMEFKNNRPPYIGMKEFFEEVGSENGRKQFQLNVETREEVMIEHNAAAYLGKETVMVSKQSYKWFEIKHRLTINKAAELCGYQLTNDKVKDDRMITMQLAEKTFRIVTFILASHPTAVQFYKSIHGLPTLPPFTSNHYAGVSSLSKQPVYFFNNAQGDFFCKAPEKSCYECEIISEEDFNRIYNEVNAQH